MRVLRDREPGDGDASAIVGTLVATMGLELAFYGALASPLRIAPPPDRVLCLSGRFALRAPQGAAALVLDAQRARFDTPSGARDVALDALDMAHDLVERPYVAIRDNTVLALADDNPLAMDEAHPDKSGNALDLGGRPTEEWRDALGDALDLVGAHLPALRAEIDLFVHQLVPVGYDEQKHLSASYREAIGTVYLTLHPRLMTMAEALIHEHSHGKLNALFETDAVLENPPDAAYASPVRPDPRPLSGLLLAVHAFLPVARLYERMREADHPLAHRPDFEARFREIVESNHEAAEVLREHARPTALGALLLEEIARWDDHFTQEVRT